MHDATSAASRKTHHAIPRPPFECIALVLQGGGALGAYQAGVYEALAEAELHPDWVAGISIGAINGALIAGNGPSERVEKLRAFWNQITDNHWEWGSRVYSTLAKGDAVRQWLNQMSAGLAMLGGAPGFFEPRFPSSLFHLPGSGEATSFYDFGNLRSTLERFVDFDRINARVTRFSVGAVNVRSGNFVYFDNATHTIRPEHIMASAALPPAFPAVEIEGEYYWDGGMVSNTPLQWVVHSLPRLDTLTFQVDLWSARGELPSTVAEVATRQKEIQYSSRTRAVTDNFKTTQRLRRAMADLLEKLPAQLQNSPEVELLRPGADRKVYNIVQLIYRARNYEGQSKDYDFSRASMVEHWRSGYHDAVRTLRHPEIFERPANSEGAFSFDLARDGRE